jgi:hypothetical protein
MLPCLVVTHEHIPCVCVCQHKFVLVLDFEDWREWSLHPTNLLLTKVPN